MSNELQGHKLGFVGLGNMGRANARHLRQAGAQLWVWNRSPGPLQAARDLGMNVAADLPSLAREVGPGVIFINLTTTAVVEEVVFGRGGLHEGLHAETLIVDMGTTAVEATRRFAAKRPWLDAPVSGGQVGAEAASLTIMAGGSNEHFQRALPLLKILGSRVTHLGPSGSGQVTKLANQLIVAQTIDAVAQALSLAKRSGVDPALVREALLGGFAESRILQLHGQRMVSGEFSPGGRSVLQLKDVRLMCELARDVGLDSPTLANSLAQWERLVNDRGLGELDHSALIRLYQD
jgi:3-hydroxyisobutyrate dehydrogenase-like beta-hydroxyacid dehydrogenase